MVIESIIRIYSEFNAIEQNYCAHCAIKRFVENLRGGGAEPAPHNFLIRPRDKSPCLDV